MKVMITHSDHFYKKGEAYTVYAWKKWGCYVVMAEELTLIDEKHAKIIT